MNANITDQDMADALNKSLTQIQELKESNKEEYEVLKTGVLCAELNLSIDDLLAIYDKKVMVE